MKTLILNFFLAISLIGNSQKKLLKDYAFNNEHYKILGLSNQLFPNGIQSQLNEFYIEDSVILNEIQNTWIIGKSKTIPGHRQDHFYHYTILLLKNGKDVESFSINLDSSIILTKTGAYEFNVGVLKSLIGKVKPFVRQEYDFASYKEGKKFEQGIQKSSQFLFSSEWNWQNYEGTFIFFYTSKDKITKVVKYLEKFISSTNPNEPFKMDVFMIGPDGELSFTLTCNQSLYNKFTLKKDKWKSMNFHLTTYCKE